MGDDLLGQILTDHAGDGKVEGPAGIGGDESLVFGAAFGGEAFALRGHGGAFGGGSLGPGGGPVVKGLDLGHVRDVCSDGGFGPIAEIARRAVGRGNAGTGLGAVADGDDAAFLFILTRAGGFIGAAQGKPAESGNKKKGHKRDEFFLHGHTPVGLSANKAGEVERRDGDETRRGVATRGKVAFMLGGRRSHGVTGLN